MQFNEGLKEGFNEGIEFREGFTEGIDTVCLPRAASLALRGPTSPRLLPIVDFPGGVNPHLAGKHFGEGTHSHLI